MTSAPQSRIAVTGASGRLGARVAQRLSAAGVPLRLVLRDAGRAPALPDAEVAEATFGDTHAVEAAPDATFTLVRHHWATEEHIKRAGVTYTFLRDNLYADFFPALAGDDGVIRGPAADGRAAVVAQDDIADAAAAVLERAHDHEGATYELTGPEAISLYDAARILSAALSRDIRYQPETVEEAYASRASYGAPDWQVEAWVTTYTAIAAGEMERVSDDVPRLTGHAATSLADLVSGGRTAY